MHWSPDVLTPAAGNKLQPYWAMFLEGHLGPDLNELESESPTMRDWTAQVLQRARLGAGEYRDAETTLHELSEAARAALFCQPGSVEEFQAMMNLAHVMASRVDRQETLKSLKAIVLEYRPPALGFWKRLLWGLEFILWGRVRYPLAHRPYLEDFT